METLDHARREAISSGREVWVVLRHDPKKRLDAERIVIWKDGKFSPEGGWVQLPSGVAFELGSGAIPDASPPPEILEAAGKAPDEGTSFGGVMFLRSGTVGWPKPGAESLLIPLDSKHVKSLVSLSRGTGKAFIAPSPGGTP